MLLILSSLLFVYVLGFVALYFSQEKFIFLDETLPEEYEYSFDQPFRELNFTSDHGDGLLNALLFEVPNPKGIILYFHGNRGNLTRWGHVAADLTKYQYDVLVMDYRGFGKSRGERNQKNLLADASQFYEWARKNYPEEQIVLFGRSLGTGLASFLTGEHAPALVILETPYYSLAEAAQRFYPIYPSRLALRYNFRSFQYLEKADCPIYIFHGTADTVVPYEQGQRLASHLKSKEVKLITIDEGGHRDLADFEQYHRELEKILSGD